MPEPDLTFTRLAGGDSADGGDARPLLVVGPSLGTSAETLWSATAELLADDFEVVGWDLPGHGRSQPAGDFGVADLAAAVRATAQQLAAGRSAFYAGVSLGGAVAFELALEPGPFRAVAALASAPRLGTPDGWHERADLVRRAGTPVMVEGSTQRWFAPGFLERDPSTANRLLLGLSDTDKDGYAACCEALAGFDAVDRLGAARVPVLVMPGEHDGVVTPEAADELTRALPDRTLQTVYGVAHLPPAEDPPQVARILADAFADGGAR